MVIFDLHILLKLSKQFHFYMKPFIYLLKNLTEKLNSALCWFWFNHLKIETVWFPNMYNTWRVQSLLWRLSPGEGREVGNWQMLTKLGGVSSLKLWNFFFTQDKSAAWRP